MNDTSPAPAHRPKGATVAEHIVDVSEPDRAREQQVAAFYTQHAAALQRTVARRAHAAEQTIE